MFDVYKGKRVLVTGHTGFKGSWLCEWLLSLGAEVYGYALKPPTNPSLFNQLQLSRRIASHMIGDVRDLKTVTKVVKKVKPDFVFHLAAQPLVRESYRTPRETFDTNVMGTVNVLDALRRVYGTTNSTNFTNSAVKQPSKTTTSAKANSCNSCNSWLRTPRCSVVMITTDKCYENRETTRPYREGDPMGGYDPYSCSKGCDELVIGSYRRSFFGSPDSPVWIASARAGNVIGGGDWAKDRIIPDCFRALRKGEAIPVRNKVSTRPWQHVLEPLSGYLTLAAALDARRDFSAVASGFNFGPNPNENRTVKEVVEELLRHVKGEWIDKGDPKAVHEAGLLNLDIRKARKVLGWKPTWNFEKTIAKVAEWYVGVQKGGKPLELTRRQIEDFVRRG